MTTYRAWNLKPLDRSALKELTAAIAQQSTEELENRAMETMDGEPWSEEKYQMTPAAQQKDHCCLWRLRCGRRDRHRPAVPAPQGDGSQRQVHAAQP